MKWIEPDWAMVGFIIASAIIFGVIAYDAGYNNGYKSRSAECANNRCSMGPLGR